MSSSSSRTYGQNNPICLRTNRWFWVPLKPLFITCGCISSRYNFSYFVIPSDMMVSAPMSSIELASAAESTKVMLYPYAFSSRATLTVLIQRLYPGMLRNKTFPVINVVVKVYNSNRAAWKRSMLRHLYIFLCPVEKNAKHVI